MRSEEKNMKRNAKHYREWTSWPLVKGMDLFPCDTRRTPLPDFRFPHIQCERISVRFAVCLDPFDLLPDYEKYEQGEKLGGEVTLRLY
jgi:hypothetical protein